MVKNQQCLKLRIFELRFLRFFESRLKKRKKSRFFGFSKKNVKTYSRTMVITRNYGIYNRDFTKSIFSQLTYCKVYNAVERSVTPFRPNRFYQRGIA